MAEALETFVVTMVILEVSSTVQAVIMLAPEEDRKEDQHLVNEANKIRLQHHERHRIRHRAHLNQIRRVVGNELADYTEVKLSLHPQQARSRHNEGFKKPEKYYDDNNNKYF